MKRNEALPGNYLAKEDFDPAVTAAVIGVEIEDVQGEHGMEKKPVLYVRNTVTGESYSRGIILNGTNWDALVDLTGEEDSDDWSDANVEIFHDTTIMFGKRKVGGIRMRVAA